MKQKKQIMVVEDNRLNREILKEILSDSYSVLEAENGQEALRLLQTHSEDVSLILLDIMMPVMDGFTFLDHIKGDEKLSAELIDRADEALYRAKRENKGYCCMWKSES